MNGKAPHHAGARFIQPDDFDRRSLAAELHHRVIQDRNGRDVPEMRIGHVNHHAIKHFLEVKRIRERQCPDLPEALSVNCIRKQQITLWIIHKLQSLRSENSLASTHFE